MPRLRVLRVIARLNVGGPAIHASLLTERLDPSRYESRLVAGRAEAGEGEYLELHGRALPGLVTLPSLGREISGVRDVQVVTALRRLMHEFRPHIVHTHTAKAGAVGRVAAWLSGVPVVVHTYHGHVLRGYFPPLKTRAFTAAERALARVSSALVAVSPRVREELLALGIGRPDRFSVVPLGLDLERFHVGAPDRLAARQALGLPADAPVVAHVARLVPIKAHEVLIAAARTLRVQRRDVIVLVVGDGERRAELEAAARDAGVADVVRFLGWRADLEVIHAAADVVALTSRNEGSPVALIEGMAAGRPVVATDVGGVADVVADGEHGLLVPSDDAPALAAALLRVLALPDRGAAMGASGRRAALARYDAARLLHDMDALYQTLVREAGVTA